MCIRDRDIYGYDVSVLDLRNPACSDGNNLLDLVNKYMDAYMAHLVQAVVWTAGLDDRLADSGLIPF